MPKTFSSINPIAAAFIKQLHDILKETRVRGGYGDKATVWSNSLTATEMREWRKKHNIRPIKLVSLKTRIKACKSKGLRPKVARQQHALVTQTRLDAAHNIIRHILSRLSETLGDDELTWHQAKVVARAEWILRAPMRERQRVRNREKTLQRNGWTRERDKKTGKITKWVKKEPSEEEG